MTEEIFCFIQGLWKTRKLDHISHLVRFGLPCCGSFWTAWKQASREGRRSDRWPRLLPLSRRLMMKTLTQPSGWRTWLHSLEVAWWEFTKRDRQDKKTRHTHSRTRIACPPQCCTTECWPTGRAGVTKHSTWLSAGGWTGSGWASPTAKPTGDSHTVPSAAHTAGGEAAEEAQPPLGAKNRKRTSLHYASSSCFATLNL